MPWFHEGLYTSGKRLKQSTGSDFVDLSLLRYVWYCVHGAFVHLEIQYSYI